MTFGVGGATSGGTGFSISGAAAVGVRVVMGRVLSLEVLLRWANMATASFSVSLPLSTKRIISRGLNMCAGVSGGVGVGTGVVVVVGTATDATVGGVTGRITGSGVGVERLIGLGVGTNVGVAVWSANPPAALIGVGVAGGTMTDGWVGNMRLDDEFACWPTSLVTFRTVSLAWPKEFGSLVLHHHTAAPPTINPNKKITTIDRDVMASSRYQCMKEVGD